MTYLEEINKLRSLLQVAAYPRRGTVEEQYDRYDIASIIHAECELEDIEPLKPYTYYAHGRYSTEREAKEGLDTCGYAGKWKKAKESVSAELTGPAYWDAVRLDFLEVGGCWLIERCECAAADAAPQRAFPIIPQVPYQEPQKVRQG
jgi:hypothetical protein